MRHSSIYGALYMMVVCWLQWSNAMPFDDNPGLSMLHTVEDERNWGSYMSAFGKKYKSESEKNEKFKNFLNNDRLIAAHNKKFENGQASYSLGHNKYSDLDPAQFLEQMTGFVPLRRQRRTNRSFNREESLNKKKRALPTSIDWRTYGFVTPVKDQMKCGCCYAFSAIQALEGQVRNKTGILTSYSEQMIVDCYNTSAGYGGCNGGYMEDVFSLINKYKGIAKETAYPYNGAVGVCNTTSRIQPLTKVTYYYVAISESALMTAVSKVGPISIAIDASLSSFQLYKSGVYSDPQCSATKLNHGVLLVGYGISSGSNTWIVKNSWGASWGTNGYVTLARNGNNTCGIWSYALYPLIT